MAKVLFSITDAQLECLAGLQRGATSDTDQRTLTGLLRRELIEQDARNGAYTLTAQGHAVLALCEKLAIRRQANR